MASPEESVGSRNMLGDAVGKHVDIGIIDNFGISFQFTGVL